MKTQQIRNVVVYSLVFWAAHINTAYAYLDPATGSMLLQGLLGGIAGAAVFIKIYWHKLTFWLGGNKSGKNNDENE